MEEKLTAEDTLIQWLERDSRHNRFPVELSREWISDQDGNDEPVIRLKYEDNSFISFPYVPEVYGSAWNFFNLYWQIKGSMLS